MISHTSDTSTNIEQLAQRVAGLEAVADRLEDALSRAGIDLDALKGSEHAV